MTKSHDTVRQAEGPSPATEGALAAELEQARAEVGRLRAIVDDLVAIAARSQAELTAAQRAMATHDQLVADLDWARRELAGRTAGRVLLEALQLRPLRRRLSDLYKRI